MSRFFAFALIASVIGFAALPGGTSQESRKEAAREAKKEAAKPVAIPKDQIYTTSAESGFKKVIKARYRTENGVDKPVFPYSYHMKELSRRHQGASNVFLVRGDGLTTIIQATRLVFLNINSADGPPAFDFDNKKIESKKGWLVVYLGSAQGGPPYWRFKSCIVKGNKVEFAYGSPTPAKEDEPRASTTDGIQYFYWVPLPTLQKGTVELKLIDSTKGRATLIRYVDFP